MLNEKFKNTSPVDEFVHQNSAFWYQKKEVDKVQRDITTLYKEDFSQYEIEDRKLTLKSIYDIIPAELNKQVCI